jgi:hypothetical protein
MASVIDETWTLDEGTRTVVIRVAAAGRRWSRVDFECIGDDRLRVAVLAPRLARAVLASEFHSTACCGCSEACPECGRIRPAVIGSGLPEHVARGHTEDCDRGKLCVELRAIAGVR